MAADKRDQAIGKKVAFFRGKMNWPLKTLAADLGVSIQQLQRYEKGVNKISATMLYELSRIFKVSVSSFFERTIDSSDIDYDTYNILLIANNVNDEFLLRKALSSYPKKLNIYTINDGYAAINFLIDFD